MDDRLPLRYVCDNLLANMILRKWSPRRKATLWFALTTVGFLVSFVGVAHYLGSIKTALVAAFVGSAAAALEDVVRKFARSSGIKIEGLKLEIKSRNGDVVASDIDAANLDELRKALSNAGQRTQSSKDAKGAS